MSQRSALLLSLALTVLVGFAIVTNRDRLLGATPATPAPPATVSAAMEKVTQQTPAATRLNARVVEVTLPSGQAEAATTGSAGIQDDDDDWDDDRDDEDDDDRYSHEDEDEDDD
jgi:hypothetical protein